MQTRKVRSKAEIKKIGETITADELSETVSSEAKNTHVKITDESKFKDFPFTLYQTGEISQNEMRIQQRKVERFTNILVKFQKQFPPDIYATDLTSKDWLKLGPKKAAKADKEFRRFLESCHRSEFQLTLIKEFDQKYSKEQIKKTLENLSHMACERKYGEKSLNHYHFCLIDKDEKIKFLFRTALKRDPDGIMQLPQEPQSMATTEVIKKDSRIRRKPSKFSPAPPSTSTGKQGKEREYKYCSCKTRRSNSTMVQCENKTKCHFGEWFHYGTHPCVDFSQESDGDDDIWFCPNCSVGNAAEQTKLLRTKQRSSDSSTGHQSQTKETSPRLEGIEESNTFSSPKRTGQDAKSSQVSETPSTSYDDMHLSPFKGTTITEPSVSSMYVSPRKRSLSADEVQYLRDIPEEVRNYTLPKNFNIVVPKESWDDIFDAKAEKLKSNWPVVINAAFSAAGIPCSFNSKGVERLSEASKLGLFSVRGYCSTRVSKHPGPTCKAEFAFHIPHVVEGSDINIQVTHTRGDFVLFQDGEASRHVRKLQRASLNDKLQTEKPKKVFVDAYTEVSDLQFYHNNFLCKGLPVIQKISSDLKPSSATRGVDVTIAIKGLHKELLSDASFQCKSFPKMSGYIQRMITIPRVTMFYSPKQARFATLCDELYLDSTGRIVPKEAGKQVLLHSLVGKIGDIPSSPAIPVMEALSTSGTAAEIDNLLSFFASDVAKFQPMYKPKLIVTDFCLAYLHGSSRAFCGMPLEEYMNERFDVLLGNRDPDERGTTLFTCTGHFMHSNSSYLNKKTLNKDAVTVAMYGYGKLTECSDVETYNRLVSRMIALFGAPNLPEILQEEYSEYLTKNAALSARLEFQENLALKNPPLFDISIPLDASLKRDQSKSYQFFVSREKTLLQNLLGKDTRKPSNPYYDQVVLKHLRDWSTYATLWSKIGFHGLKVPSQTITTGYVEQVFNEVKHIFHTKPLIPEVDFIRQRSKVTDGLADNAIRQGRKVKRSQRTKKASTQTFPSVSVTRTGSRHLYPFAANTWLKRTKKPRRPYRLGLSVLKKLKKSPSKMPGYKKNEEVLLLSGEDSNDQFGLKEMTWVEEMEEISGLFGSSLSSASGNEGDVISLMGNNFVTSSVATEWLRLRIKDENGDDDVSNVVLDSEVVISKKPKYEDAEFFQDIQSLFPPADTLDINKVNFYLVSFFGGHAWLTTMKIDNGLHEMKYYDSLPTFTSPTKRKEYFKCLQAGMAKKYGISSKSWTVNEGSTPTQKGNDCVIISLKTAEALILGKRPSDWIFPEIGQVYRSMIATDLLKSTDVGNQVLSYFGDDVHLLQCAFKKRALERQKQQKIFNLRNEHSETIAKIKRTMSTATKKALEKRAGSLETRIKQWIEKYTQQFDSSGVRIKTDMLQQ